MASLSNTTYDHLFKKYGNLRGIDPKLLKAMAYQESRFNPKAKSHMGAVGILQLMPATAMGEGLVISKGFLGIGAKDERLDPEKNIKGGSSYLKKQFNRFGNSAKAVAAYNAGPGNVNKSVKKFGINWWANFPKLNKVFHETKDYVAKVSSHYGKLGGTLYSKLKSFEGRKAGGTGISGKTILWVAGIGLGLYFSRKDIAKSFKKAA